jgi:hypothetical protein
VVHFKVASNRCTSPWTGNCIGLLNQKIFLAFLVNLVASYLVELACVGVLLVARLGDSIGPAWPWLVLVQVVQCAIALRLGGRLLLWQAYFAFRNGTTIEWKQLTHRACARVHHSAGAAAQADEAGTRHEPADDPRGKPVRHFEHDLGSACKNLAQARSRSLPAPPSLFLQSFCDFLVCADHYHLLLTAQVLGRRPWLNACLPYPPLLAEPAY